jgi:hypothetical protein
MSAFDHVQVFRHWTRLGVMELCGNPYFIFVYLPDPPFHFHLHTAVLVKKPLEDPIANQYTGFEAIRIEAVVPYWLVRSVGYHIGGSLVVGRALGLCLMAVVEGLEVSLVVGRSYPDK